MNETRPAAFEVRDCSLITLSLGKSAQNLRELRDRVAEVPADSLRHHLYEGLLRPSFDDPEFRNDFAVWAHEALRDDVLAERLAALDPAEFDDWESLRLTLLDRIEDRLAEVAPALAVLPGHDFHFLVARVLVFDSGLRANSPRDLFDVMPRISRGSVFHHFVEARLREPRGKDDFGHWLAAWGPEGELARSRIDAIDPLFGTLPELRERLTAALAGVYGAVA